MDGMQWMLRPGRETFLLVAVDGRGDAASGFPCRVVGSFSPTQLPETREDPAARISRLLSEIGVPRNLLGWAYLRTALTLLMEEPALGRTITRDLYPRVAKCHQTSAPSVERAIRHAIAQTFARQGGEGYRAALGRLASAVGDKPTNSEFLAQVSERLRLGA